MPCLPDLFASARIANSGIDEFCRSSKRACQSHYSWEKLRRAELDMARVKQWMKVDELLEQERQVRATLASRAGVLGLLLHSTFNHEIDEKNACNRTTKQSSTPCQMNFLLSQDSRMKK